MGAIPASRLPKVLDAGEKPRHGAYEARAAWSLCKAFTELANTASPRAKVEDIPRLTQVFRPELTLGA